MRDLEAITGLVLAGGAARRIAHRDKGLVELGGRALVEWVIERLQPQVADLLISANRNQDKYLRYGYPVLADTLAGNRGPLAGILTALQRVATPWLLVVPCDVPCLPLDLAVRLGMAVQEQGGRLAAAHDGQRLQSLCCLIHRDLVENLCEYLAGGEAAVHVWLRRNGVRVVDFSDAKENFVNVNTPEDLAAMAPKLGNAGS